MIENARHGGQRVGVEMELGKEKNNERSKERERFRDGETGTFSKSKTSIGGKEGPALCHRFRLSSVARACVQAVRGV